MPIKIGVVFVIYRDRENLKEAVSSLRDSETEGLVIREFVVDNSRFNLGFVGGNNEGIRQALKWGAEAVVLLNDDTKVGNKAILYLHKSLEVYETSMPGVVVPKIYFYPGFEYHKNRYRKSQLGKVLWYAGGKIDWDNCIGIHRGVDEVDRGQFDRKEEVEFATGCSMMITKRALEKVGLLDKKYFMYLEDLDYSVRIRGAGFKIMYEPKAIIWHKNAQSSGVGSELNDYFFTRNRLLFGMAYASTRTKLALIRESGRLVFQGRKWQRRGVRDFYLHKFEKGSWVE